MARWWRRSAAARASRSHDAEARHSRRRCGVLARYLLLIDGLIPYTSYDRILVAIKALWIRVYPIEALHGGMKLYSHRATDWRPRNPATRSVFPIPDGLIEPAIVAARTFLRASLSRAALYPARSPEKRHRPHCSVPAPSLLS